MRIATFITLLFGLLFASADSHAQIFGLEAILNPEGSRLFPSTIIAPRHPGKPDPRWRNFAWRYVDLRGGASPFRLYFYDEEEWAARFCAPRIQTQVERLTKIFGTGLTKPFSYLLFTSLREFRQANIFFITEGVQGVTSTTEATMAIPYWGNPKEFDHVSTHEMVHQFQVQKIETLGAAQGFAKGDGMELVPLWFIEGMAEYYSWSGIDPETRAILRDLTLFPNSDRNYTIPDFTEAGPMDYIHVYKLGQARMDFLETRFGSGTIQRLFQDILDPKKMKGRSFKNALPELLGLSGEEINREWRAYINRTFGGVALADGIQKEREVLGSAPNLDFYRISPDGQLLAYRAVDELTGISSIYLARLDSPDRRIEVVRDGSSDVASLFFLQNPSFTLSNQSLAYAVDTASGPEIEFRSIRSGPNRSLRLERAQRVEVHRSGLLQVSSLAFSPEATQIAFTAVDNRGWSNPYLLEWPIGRKSIPRRIYEEPYDWQGLSWSPYGLLASSNRSHDGHYAIFRITIDQPSPSQLTFPVSDQFFPEAISAESIVLQSADSGVPQISLRHSSEPTEIERQLTTLASGARAPLVRNGKLYALKLHEGRYRIFESKMSPNLPNQKPGVAGSAPLISQAASNGGGQPWAIRPADFSPGSIQRYRPFRDSSTRIDGIMGYFASGGALGVGAGISDLFRDYSLSGEFTLLGNIKYSNAYVFLSTSKGRSTWTAGAYAILQPRLDNIFPTDNNEGIRTYLHREYGILGAHQYPLGLFSFVDMELRLAGVKRSDLSDPTLSADWETHNPGTEPLIAPVLRIGYDSILYELFTGPLHGFGAMAEMEKSVFPKRGLTATRVRLDMAKYFQLTGRTVLAFQAMTGSSWGRDFGNPFLLSSDDILRGYASFDERLYGNYFSAAKTELRFPVGSLIGFPPLRGLLAYDLGTVYRTPGTAGQHVSSSSTWGFSINIPPLAINFMFSEPHRIAPGAAAESVAHFTLRYLYL